jgi:hypothetical protein
MLRLALVAAVVCGCGNVERQFQIVPALTGCIPANINSVQLLSLGDFPPAPAHTTATPPMGQTSLTLPAGTRVLEIDGLGPTGLLAFGRSAPFDLAGLGPRVALNYGPPDSVCATSNLNYARAGHQATLLPSGSVLLSGGHDDNGFAVPKLELYVPFGDDATPPATFRVVDPNGVTALDPHAALGHAVAVLPGGDFLITGGAPSSGGRPLGIAYEGYSHHDQNGVRVNDPQVLFGGGRAFHTATVLADGSVIFLGGCARFDNTGCAADSVLGDSIRYNQGQWSAGPSLLHPRWGHQAFLRGDGKILVIGGGPAELFDPAGTGTDLGPLAGVAAQLPTGATLAVDSSSATWWIDGESVPLTPLPSTRSGHTLTTLEDGSALVAGGGDPALVLYHPVLGPLPLAGPFLRREHSATRLGDGSVLLAGGTETSGASLKASIFLHSPLGPFSNLPTLTFDTADVPVVPRRPDRLRLANGYLDLDAPAPSADGRPAELALVGALDLGDLQLSLVAATDGGAALIFSWQSDAHYAFVSLTPGQPVTFNTVRNGVLQSSCRGETLLPEELRAGADMLAPLILDWRSGTLQVFSPGRRLLLCSPGDLGRGMVGVGSLAGHALFDGLSITR